MNVRPFYSAGGINVEMYDARTAGFPGEIDFWVDRARASGGPVLELACGTGRVSWPIARAGMSIVGLDIEAAMLERAEAKRAAADADVNARIRFQPGDMTGFELGERFALVIIPFRAFQSLLTPDAQRRALACARRHLVPNGRLIIDVFDPRLDYVVPGSGPPPIPRPPSARHPVSGNDVSIEVIDRMNDPVRQYFYEDWRFTERSQGGDVVREEVERLELRWTYRYEMMYLLELSGFVIEDELSDFFGAGPAYGREQVWVARAS